MTKPKYKVVVVLLFAWSVMWVPTFVFFWVRQCIRHLPSIFENAILIKYIVPILSVSGELAIFLACMVKIIHIIKRNYGPLWLNVILLFALAVNYWHWLLISRIVLS